MRDAAVQKQAAEQSNQGDVAEANPEGHDEHDHERQSHRDKGQLFAFELVAANLDVEPGLMTPSTNPSGGKRTANTTAAMASLD